VCESQNDLRELAEKHELHEFERNRQQPESLNKLSPNPTLKPIVSVYKAQTRDKLTEKDDIAGAFEEGQDSSLRCLGLRLELIQP
jgi:hypothetical protein